MVFYATAIIFFSEILKNL